MARKFDLISELYERTCFAVTDNPVNWQSFLKTAGRNFRLRFDEQLLIYFSCHSLRHTFTTRMCEAGVNVKVIQDTLGHKDISTTLNIYTDVTKELRRSEFEGLDSYFKNEYNKANEVL